MYFYYYLLINDFDLLLLLVVDCIVLEVEVFSMNLEVGGINFIIFFVSLFFDFWFSLFWLNFVCLFILDVFFLLDVFEDFGLLNIWEFFLNRLELLSVDFFVLNFWLILFVCVKDLNFEDVDWVGLLNDFFFLGGFLFNILLGVDGISLKGVFFVFVMVLKVEIFVVVEFLYLMDVDVLNVVLVLVEIELIVLFLVVDDENILFCLKNVGVGWEFREFIVFFDEDICIFLLFCLFVVLNVVFVLNDDVLFLIDKKNVKKCYVI